jgi:hypothetical protein
MKRKPCKGDIGATHTHISPLQGFGTPGDPLPQGVALGFRITPLRGWTA